MEISYSIKNASKVNKKDLMKALDIYTKTFDKFSETNTNEIIDYIEKKYTDNRIMFFYVLYLNGEVYGFAEYGYLRKNKVLMLDYLCTKERNHTLFYSFYYLIYEEIKSILVKKNLFIEYIVTELSLFKDNGKLIDIDSNYFRQLLSFERFHILNIPYKQPYFSNNELSFYEFNLAIKKADSYESYSYKYDKKFYFNLIEEIFIEHYLNWFLHYTDKKIELKKALEEQLTIIKKEYPPDLEIKEVESVNCYLFTKGLCNHMKPETITITDLKKRKIKKYVSILIWIILSVVSIFLCYFQNKLYITNYVTSITSSISFLSGIITIIPYFKNHFIS